MEGEAIDLTGDDHDDTQPSETFVWQVSCGDDGSVLHSRALSLYTYSRALSLYAFPRALSLYLSARALSLYIYVCTRTRAF